MDLYNFLECIQKNNEKAKSCQNLAIGLERRRRRRRRKCQSVNNLTSIVVEKEKCESKICLSQEEKENDLCEWANLKIEFMPFDKDVINQCLDTRASKY